MKIAILAPSPVPFRIGGIENLVWSITDYINKETKHSADLIKLPSRELDFWSLIDTYKTFYDLDLSHFDAVITSKYPCWMIRHDNVVTYMAHCLRGLYDVYFMTGLPTEVDRNNRFINRIVDYMEENPDPKSLDEFFEMVYDLQKIKIPDSYYMFPGPFIRLLVHYMDKFGLSYSGRKNFFSISDTVKKRTEYYPEGANVRTLYPESEKQDFTEGNYEYVFMISRLDGAKRIDLLVKAMKYVKADIKLKIAGTGPCAAELKELAGDDKRIEFLGFVSDEDATKLYANALVIPYFPYDEDYGYITAEAMMHKKPVITTRDAGGPTEFTIDNETGFVVDTDPEAIAKAIDYMAANPEEAKRMGKNAFEKVKDISWNNVVKELIAELEVKNSRKKIVVPVSFGVYPPKGGGQARLYNIYKNIAKDYDVEIVSNVCQGLTVPVVKSKIADGMKEIQVQASEQFIAYRNELNRKFGTATDDTACLMAYDKNPAYINALRESLRDADLMVFSHPYMYKAFKATGIDIPFAYEAQDVDYNIKKGMYGDSPEAQAAVEYVFEAEKACCLEAKFVFTCSEEDADTLCELYGCDRSKMIVIPNGVDCSAVEFSDIASRKKNRALIDYTDDKICIFMGSYHKPNLEACDFIIDIAPKCPSTVFFLMGSQCSNYVNKELPDNVGLLGFAADDVKDKLFKAADFALNPMFSGSGTNLKMFDYMAAGMPVITTEFGTRGIDDKDCFIVADKDTFADAINNFSLDNEHERVTKAHKVVREVFDWEVIAKPLAKKFEEIIS